MIWLVLLIGWLWLFGAIAAASMWRGRGPCWAVAMNAIIWPVALPLLLIFWFGVAVWMLFAWPERD